MYPFSRLVVFLVLPYQACLACSPIKKMYRFCEDLRMGNGYVYQYETPAGSKMEVYSNNTPIAYRGMNKPFEANVSDKGMVVECHLHYIVAEREHEAVTTINLTDKMTDTSDNTSGNGDKAKATSHTKEITAGVLVLLLGIAGFLMYRYCYIPCRDKHLDNGDPDDPAAEDAESLRSVLVVDSQGERGEPSERFVQPMGSEETDTEFSQKRNAGFPLVNGNHTARVNGQTDDAQLLGQPQSNGRAPYIRVNDETKEPTPDAQSPGPPQMNGGPPMSDRLENNPVGQQVKKTALVNKQDQDWSTMA